MAATPRMKKPGVGRTRTSRERIVNEIRRLAASSPGTALGIRTFTKESGIPRADWEGVYWTKWSDALREAGASPNTLNQPYPEDALLQALADLTRQLGRVPAKNDLKFAWNNRTDFPAPNTFYKRFDSRAGLIEALRRWTAERLEYADVLALLPGAAPQRAREDVDAQPEVVSDSFVPPVVAALPSLARMEGENPIEFERRVATAFEMLGLEVQRLGQGSGREPDGIAKCREHGWAVIYDAKASSSAYRIRAAEERKFREYVERHAHNLIGEGMAQLYFALVSSAFSEADLPKARDLCRVTAAKAVALLEASALVKMVEQHVASPRTFGRRSVGLLLSETRIVSPSHVGDGKPLELAPTRPAPSLPVDPVEAGGDSAMFATLMGRWPDFESKVKTLAEFFDYSLIYCLATPLQSTEGLDMSKPEDAALSGERGEALRALGFVNHVAYNLVKDLCPRASTVEDARRLVARFRTLIAAPAILGIENLYQVLASRSRSPEEFTARMERFKAFKHDWESFARAANQHLGVEFFKPYVP